MYPLIIVGDNIRIYVFGIFLIISWLLFFYLLHTFSQAKGIAKHIFGDIISFTISIFFFGRLFYFLSQWRTEKFVIQSFMSGESSIFEFLYVFFINNNYNLSLAGGVLGFVLVLLWKTRNQKKLRAKYFDVILPSFLITSAVLYIGGFLGGQVYGNPTNLFFGINYDTKYSDIPFRSSVFPLPFFYLIGVSLLLLFWWKISSKKMPDGYLGSLLIGGFGILLYIGEFFSGKSDIFSDYIRLNQFLALIFIGIGFLGILKKIRS